MRSRGRCLRADAMAAGAWPDPFDVSQRRGLDVRGRRQRPVAPGARQRRSADHAAAVVFAGTGAIFFGAPCRSGPGPFVVPNSETFCGRGRPGSPQPRSSPMRFMFIITSPQPNRGPTPALMEAMHKLADREIKAGRMIDSGGLMPVSTGAQVKVADGKLSVVDGPFVEAKELIGGYAIFELRDKEEAVAAAVEFMQLHKEHMPGWEGTCDGPSFATPGAEMACQVEARVAS